jgi:glycosyltransferase involved in cell wall biosynthesis
LNSPKVSVLTPVYNGADFLATALQSTLDQSFQDFEVMVVNDGSTDNSEQIAQSFSAKSPEQIKVFTQVNGGLCAARNRGIAEARGEYLALLDADDAWHRDHLARCVEVLDKHPEIGLVHANIRRVDTQGNEVSVPLRHWRAHEAQPWRALFLRDEHVSCPTAVFRTSLVQQLGNFDMYFNKLGCEDRDMWLRIASVAGVHYLDDIQADYRLHNSNMSKASAKMLEARLRLIKKHGATPAGSALQSHAMSALHADMGDERRAAGQFNEALSNYWGALKHRPVNIRALKGIVNALIRRA